MRPLWKWTTAALPLAFSLAIASPVAAQQLQWQHASQTRARSAKVTPAPAPASPAPETRSVEVKRPTFRQPKPFQQSAVARPIDPTREVRSEPAEQTTPTKSAAKLAAEQASRLRDTAVQPAVQSPPAPVRTAMQPRSRSNSGAPVGLESLADQVVPAQWEGPMGPPTCDCPECSGEVVYGEVDGGFPGPVCGDGFSVAEPGCGIAYGNEVGCGVPFVEEGCADACCGGVGEPTCGCGSECSHWPQSLFGCSERGCVPILWVPPIREMVLFGGVQGFKSPLDGTRDGGNFGFHEGFNLGGEMAWLPWPGLGYQFGYQATHNQLSGDWNSGIDGAHSQHFITTGLFHRKRLGLQYGLVWDMMHDERQGANDFGQVRGELSFKNMTNRELGFAFTANSNDNRIDDVTYHATDRYLLFYRINGRQGGECRAFGGFASDSAGIIGSDFHTPLTNRWSLEGNWTYLIPDEGEEGSGAREEGWNIGLQLVWHYGNRAKSWHNRPFRPLFDVANNGSLIVVD